MSIDTPTAGQEISDRSVSGSASARAFIGVSIVFFAAAAVATIACSASMAEMGGMSMPGGWTLSMAWMRMPGRTWPGAAASFLAMWVAMMAAMMLPSLAPMLWRYRQSVAEKAGAHARRLTMLAGAGYFFVWTMLGVPVFLLGTVLATVEMALPAVARAVPIAVGGIVVVAGALQFTTWKMRHLACCRRTATHGRALPLDSFGAWRYGLGLGLHCSYCCAGLMTILLVTGMMDLRAMVVVTAAITLERLAPAARPVARAIGAAAILTGLLLIAQAAGNG